jgi:hypothetical protein
MHFSSVGFVPKAVFLGSLSRHHFGKHQITYALPGTVPDVRLHFGRINAVKSNLVLHLVCVQDSHFIAISHADHAVVNGCCMAGQAKEVCE